MKKPRSPYADERGRPVLRDSYCVFLDVLGFRQMVRDSFAGGNPSILFGQFHEVVQSELKRLNDTHSSSDERLWDLKVFTDNIVLGYPLFSTDGESELGFVLGRVAEYQLAMALAGFFVRGGISIGPLFMDDNTVYGPAILEAYEVESELARDPRIALSKGVHSRVMEHTKYYAEPEDSPQNRDLLVDPDGHAFVNYLDQLVVENFEGPFVAWKRLAQHKNRIESNLIKMQDKPAVWSKYYWLANYHDYFCSAHENLEGYRKSYRIDSRLARPEFSPLVKTP